MLCDPEHRLVLSSLGWVDGDALWVFDSSEGRAQTLPLETGARYASLHAGDTHRFAVCHHFDGKRFEVTVRSFADPTRVEARAVVVEGRTELVGDPAAWAAVPRLFVEHLSFPPWNEYVLLHISAATERITISRLNWHDDSYDKGYQGVTGAIRLPTLDEQNLAIVSVQRSSRIVLHDLDTGNAKRFIELADRGGNPRLALRDGNAQLWASDYDSLLVLNTADWRVTQRQHLQGADRGCQQFIGDFSFTQDGRCIVPRPFSGDVVVLDPQNLKLKWKAKLAREPLQAAMLARGDIVARDWKSGALLRGTPRRTWFGG